VFEQDDGQSIVRTRNTGGRIYKQRKAAQGNSR